MTVRLRLRILFAIAGVACWLEGTVSRADVRNAEVPSWVEPVSFEPCAFKREVLFDGTCHLLSDVQQRLTDRRQEEYHHLAQEVVNQIGVEAESEIEIDFSPAFEKVTVHYIRVRRGTSVFERFDRKNVTEMRREEELDARMLIGSVTLHIIVEDVRPGDVLEYAFTIEGQNAVLGDRYFASQWTAWPAPVQKVMGRVLAPSGRSIQFRPYLTDKVPTVTQRSDGFAEYRISLENVPAVTVEPNLPVWYDPLPRIDFSTAEDWAEIAAWGTSLYRNPGPLSKALQQEIDHIARQTDEPSARAALALRFVQDEIRYLGIEIGEGSYRPSPPSTVFERRFGDCKDKTNLLVVMLKALGMEAYPALVNLNLLEHVDEQLPSAAAFNHVIVAVSLDGILYFADPTGRAVPGRFRDLVQPDYGKALLLRDGETGFTPIRRRTLTAPTKIIEEVFDVSKGPGFPGVLNVKTTFLDEEADLVKESLSAESRSALFVELMKYYQTDFPSIEAVAPAVVTVDDKENRVVIEERYRIPDAWTRSGPGYALSLVPRELHDFLTTPVERDRRMPLGLEYPLYITQETRVMLPPGVTLKEQSINEGDGTFAYRHQVRKQPDGYLISYAYRTLRDFVSPKMVTAHQLRRERAAKAMGYTLLSSPSQTSRSVSPPFSAYPWHLSLVVSSAFFMLFGSMVIVRIYRFDPPHSNGAATEPAPFGIWLGLLGVSLVLAPVLGVYTLARLFTVFHSDTLVAYFSGAIARPNGWMTLVLGKVGFQLLNLAFSALLIVLFFTRRQIFPFVFIWTAVGRLVLFAADVVGSRLVLGSERYTYNYLSMSGVLFYTLLWCFFLVASKRVKAVFVGRRIAGNVELPRSEEGMDSL